MHNEIKDFRLLFSAGDLRDAFIKPSELDGCYNLFFHRNSTSEVCAVFTRRSRAIRHFKTIDAAFASAVDVGFDSVQVIR